MRVVDRKTFMAMPEGTIYAKGPQWAFGDLMVKGETLPVPDAASGGDWVCLSFNTIECDSSGDCVERLDEMLERGTSYPMNDSSGRDGAFDLKEFFLIYERADLIKLRGYIDGAIYGPGATDRDVLSAEEETLTRAIAEDNLSLDEMIPDALDEARGIGYRQGYHQGLADAAIPDEVKE